MQTEVLFKHLSLFLSSPDKSYLLILLNFVWNFRNYLILQHKAHWTCTFEGHGAHVSSSTNLPLKTKSSQNQVNPNFIVLFHIKKNVCLHYKLLHKWTNSLLKEYICHSIQLYSKTNKLMFFYFSMFVRFCPKYFGSSYMVTSDFLLTENRESAMCRVPVVSGTLMLMQLYHAELLLT